MIIYKENNELVPFAKILESDVANFRITEEFAKSEFSYIDNSPEEILELLKELLDGIQADSQLESSTLQGKFRNLFRPNHWSYHAVGMCGSSFLKKYQNLI